MDQVEQLLGIELTQDEENELGALPATVKAKIGELRAKAVKTAVASRALDPKQKLFLARTGDANPDIRQAIAKGGMSLKNKTYYARKRYATLVNGELLTANDDVVVGGINFQKRRIDTGTTFQVNTVKIGYGFVAAGTTPEPNTVVFSNSVDASLTGGTNSMPNWVVNGKLQIKKNGNIHTEIELSDAIRDTLSVAVGVNGAFDGVKLPNPIMFKDTDNIDLTFIPAEGIAPAAGNHYIEARLIGDEISPRS